MNIPEGNDIIIYSLRVYDELLKEGFKPKRIANNIKFPEFKVFIFPYDEKIVEVLEKYKKQ